MIKLKDLLNEIQVANLQSNVNVRKLKSIHLGSTFWYKEYPYKVDNITISGTNIDGMVIGRTYRSKINGGNDVDINYDVFKTIKHFSIGGHSISKTNMNAGRVSFVFNNTKTPYKLDTQLQHFQKPKSEPESQKDYPWRGTEKFNEIQITKLPIGVQIYNSLKVGDIISFNYITSAITLSKDRSQQKIAEKYSLDGEYILELDNGGRLVYCDIPGITNPNWQQEFLTIKKVMNELQVADPNDAKIREINKLLTELVSSTKSWTKMKKEISNRIGTDIDFVWGDYENDNSLFIDELGRDIKPQYRKFASQILKYLKQVVAKHDEPLDEIQVAKPNKYRVGEKLKHRDGDIGIVEEIKKYKHAKTSRYWNYGNTDFTGSENENWYLIYFPSDEMKFWCIETTLDKQYARVVNK